MGLVEELKKRLKSLKVENKKCTKCGKFKDISRFHKRKGGAHGVRSDCKVCRREVRVKIYWENVENARKASREYRKDNRAICILKGRIAGKKYRSNNKDKVKQRGKLYRNNNKASECAKTARYKAAKLNATPTWLTVDQHAEILEFYTDAQELSWLSTEKLHVDHIIPLRGENVSGLHVPWNLQILPSGDNMRKGNKLI